MTSTYKERDEHRGIPAPHVGQDHFEKSQVERAAAAGDSGPRFDSTPNGSAGDGEFHEQPQQPADVTHQAREGVEEGSTGTPPTPPEELTEAVRDLDSGFAAKP